MERMFLQARPERIVELNDKMEKCEIKKKNILCEGNKINCIKSILIKMYKTLF